jgi:GNAT superfamily N-acetyltransferase
MFWKGKVSFLKQLECFIKQDDVSLIDIKPPDVPLNVTYGKCRISVSNLNDSHGISRLLNEWFEETDSKSKADITPQWIRASYIERDAIWIVAKDPGGTIRGCVCSFRIPAPYKNSLSGCGKPYVWGLVDWYCVHPLWRNKGVGSALLESLDFITYRIGRKAHIFLKEGMPLALPHIPIYTTRLLCRKAGNKSITNMREGTGLIVYPYQEIERESGLPLVRIEGLTTTISVDDWEDTLDKELPECWVFVTSDSYVDYKKGWKSDSLVSMYAFRWTPGRWLGSKPISTL